MGNANPKHIKNAIVGMDLKGEKEMLVVQEEMPADQVHYKL